MAQELPDRLKGAKSLPDGKVQLRDGTVMSKSAWNSRRSAFGAPELVQIRTGRTTAKKAAATRKEKAMAKRGAKDIKKGNKTDPFSRTEKMKKRDLTPAKNQTRINAANRAKPLPPTERTPAQTRAIKTESRIRTELEWRKAQADAKREQKQIRTTAKKSKPRGGRMGGMLGGGSLTSRTK
jgi:hypothetical protein